MRKNIKKKNCICSDLKYLYPALISLNNVLMHIQLTCQYYLRHNCIIRLKKKAEFVDGLKKVSQEVTENHKAPIFHHPLDL